MQKLALVRDVLEVPVLVLLADVLEVELAVVLVVDVFDVFALLVEVLEGVYGAPNLMIGVGSVNVESSCAKRMQ